MNSLPKLSVGGVNIMAPELCYATSDLLEDIFKSADTVTTSIPESAAETCGNNSTSSLLFLSLSNLPSCRMNFTPRR